MNKYKATLISTCISAICVFSQITMPSLFTGSMTLLGLESEIWGVYACLLVVAIILSYGIYCDIKRARKARVASDIHSTMIFATHHILNNFLNGMELVRMEANNSKDFDKNIIKLYEEAYHDAMTKIERVSKIKEPTEEKIWDALIPGMKPPV